MAQVANQRFGRTGLGDPQALGVACEGLSTILVGIGEPDHIEQMLGAIEMGPLDTLECAPIAEAWQRDHAFVSLPPVRLVI